MGDHLQNEFIFYLDYLEQMTKFYICGRADPMCVYNCVQSRGQVRGGHVGGWRGGERGEECERRERGEQGGIWQLQGEWRGCQIL